eukprot:CAMPEP_0177790190 /NCGR_PEP_ID=MMETSP0491_2-20121128/23196_1 /TAXON_ID=63592 /ORGANISM="Tetraselmis chuii, Strain PLY429" /LENGTH=47 /DNA_ID= /DNA_START= /DNA_END= /DNA_ORIENTATION=
MTPAQPAERSMRTASVASNMSPLPMTGMDSSRVSCAMASHRASGPYS